ncbi:MAG: hypothetical protein ABSB35_24405 [Bryobacteraceae bacterium]|jgi:hypothetical protein
MTDNRNETYYYDPTTGERVTATYRVQLTMPANHDGYLEVEAHSEEEAARLALDKSWLDIEWECNDIGDRHGIEVCYVECDDPPEGALLSRPGSSEADISVLFEDAPADHMPMEGSSSRKDGQQGSTTGSGDPCK